MVGWRLLKACKTYCFCQKDIQCSVVLIRYCSSHEITYSSLVEHGVFELDACSDMPRIDFPKFALILFHIRSSGLTSTAFSWTVVQYYVGIQSHSLCPSSESSCTQFFFYPHLLSIPKVIPQNTWTQCAGCSGIFVEECECFASQSRITSANLHWLFIFVVRYFLRDLASIRLSGHRLKLEKWKKNRVKWWFRCYITYISVFQ
jgi:hypothetical protein